MAKDDLHNRLIIFSLSLVLTLIIFPYDSFAEESIPSWIKTTASAWINGSVSDKEFINAIQYMIENDIIKIEQNIDEIKGETGFGMLTCTYSGSAATANGKFTSPDNYSSVYIESAFLDKNGNILATGLGVISNIKEGETKFFKADSTFREPYDYCEVQVGSAFK